jgi:hypothetical protein
MEKTKIDLFQADTETIIAIGEKIIQRHTALGPLSPLSNIVVADLNARISSAKQKHAEGMKYKRLMEDAWQDRDRFLGSPDKGVKYTLEAIGATIKDGNLSMDEWGF